MSGPIPSHVKDRIRGSLLAAAAGDALGSAFEFVTSAHIHAALSRTARSSPNSPRRRRAYRTRIRQRLPQRKPWC
jgi:ADP-ribosylglycohydrolase